MAAAHWHQAKDTEVDVAEVCLHMMGVRIA